MTLCQWLYMQHSIDAVSMVVYATSLGYGYVTVT
jgi:hypothetical protein